MSLSASNSRRVTLKLPRRSVPVSRYWRIDWPGKSDRRPWYERRFRLNYRPLGSSKLLVSEIALGSWLNVSEVDAKTKAIAFVRRALERGITLIDTANVYGRGVAEQVLGEALSTVRRDSYVLATKLFFPMSGTDRGLSRDQIHKQLDASLLRLRVDHVDLYQCHRYDADTPLEETMAALSEVVRAGKVRYIGFSEWPVDRVEAALAIPGVEKFVSSQPQYSLLHRDPERSLLPLCAKNGISQIVWSPLAQGDQTICDMPFFAHNGSSERSGSRCRSEYCG